MARTHMDSREAQTLVTYRPRWRRGLLVLSVSLLITLTLALIASFVLRSEWFLRSRVDAKLAGLGEKLQGSFTYEGLRPVGFTGVEIEGLRFEPDEEGIPSPLSVDKIVVYPNVFAILGGELQPRLIEVSGLNVELWLDGGASGRGHWPWMERAVEAWRNRPPPPPSSGDPEEDERNAPLLRIHDGRVDVRSPQGTMPHLGLALDAMDIRLVRDKVQLEGGIQVDGLGYALLSGDASRKDKKAGVVVQLVDHPDLLTVHEESHKIREIVGPDSRLELDGIRLQWPPALVLKNLKLTDTHIAVPGNDSNYLESIGAGSVALSLNEGTANLRVEDMEASMHVSLLDGLGTSVPVSLPELGVVLDMEKRKLGAGFEYRDDEGGALELALALDLDAMDMAIRMAAQHFDAGPILSFVPYTGPVNVRQGRIDGTFHMRYPLHTGLAQVRTDMRFEDVELNVPWISRETMRGLHLGMAMDMLVDLEARKLTLSQGDMMLGQMPFSLTGEVQQVGGPHVRIEAQLKGENIPAEGLIEGFPQGFVPALEDFELGGVLSIELGIALDTREPKALELEHHIDVSQLWVDRYGRANIPVLATKDFAIRVQTASTEHIIGPSTESWTRYRKLPRFLVQSLISAEDNSFFNHEGFDTLGIRNSLVANIEARDVIRGGSTISQQVVKNLYLDGSKTLSRKLQELFLTWQLELLVPKRRILELYFNLAHWGRDVYGIQAATRHYFDKHPAQLNLREAVFLASILPSPIRFGDAYARGDIPEDRRSKMRSILKNLRARGAINSDQQGHAWRRIARGKISRRRRPKPYVAPQPEPPEDTAIAAPVAEGLALESWTSRSALP